MRHGPHQAAVKSTTICTEWRDLSALNNGVILRWSLRQVTHRFVGVLAEQLVPLVFRLNVNYRMIADHLIGVARALLAVCLHWP